MSKQEFLDSLRSKLDGLQKQGVLSKQDMQERLNFYSEMIDDRMDEGLAEEEAVAAVGSADDIAVQLAEELSATKTEGGAEPSKEKAKTKRPLKAWEIVLLALGSPLWVVLLAVALVVLLAVYAVLWSLIATLWAVFAGLCGGALGGVAGGIGLIPAGNGLASMALAGAGLFCGGLAILLFFGCLAATKGTAVFSKKIILGIARSIK